MQSMLSFSFYNFNINRKKGCGTQPDQNSNRTITVTGDEVSKQDCPNTRESYMMNENQCIIVYHNLLRSPLFQDDAPDIKCHMIKYRSKIG